MSDLKVILLKSGVAIATIGLFFIALPLVIFFSAIVLVTGLAIAITARYRLSRTLKTEANTVNHRQNNIIEGSYEVK